MKQMCVVTWDGGREVIRDAELGDPRIAALLDRLAAGHARNPEIRFEEQDSLAVVMLTEKGVERVLRGRKGMTFLVDKFTDTVDGRGRMAHVRDYSFPGPNYQWQIWSLGPEHYVIIQEAE